jgi:SnoaL-like polyketide cyclase
VQQAFDRLGTDIVDAVETPDRIVIAFIMRGRHAGPYLSPLGAVAPTQRDKELHTIDILTIADDLISAIWVVSDDLAVLCQLGAVTLTPSQHPGP